MSTLSQFIALGLGLILSHGVVAYMAYQEGKMKGWWDAKREEAVKLKD